MAGPRPEDVVSEGAMALFWTDKQHRAIKVTRGRYGAATHFAGCPCKTYPFLTRPSVAFPCWPSRELPSTLTSILQLGNLVFNIDGAIGKIYGSTFEVQGKQLVVTDAAALDLQLLPGPADDSAADNADDNAQALPLRDNRHLKHDPKNQAMTDEDVLALKEHDAQVCHAVLHGAAPSEHVVVAARFAVVHCVLTWRIQPLLLRTWLPWVAGVDPEAGAAEYNISKQDGFLSGKIHQQKKEKVSADTADPSNAVS